MSEKYDKNSGATGKTRAHTHTHRPCVSQTLEFHEHLEF